MKKAFLLTIIFLNATLSAVFAAAEPENTGGGKGNNIIAILFVVGLIVFLVVVRKLYEARNKNAEKRAAADKPVIKENIYEPKYWFQCKNCRVTIRKDFMPNIADCFQAPDHLWTQLAEVGTQKYLCRNCSTLVETKSEPVSENCPAAPVHDWERLP